MRFLCVQCKEIRSLPQHLSVPTIFPHGLRHIHLHNRPFCGAAVSPPDSWHPQPSPALTHLASCLPGTPAPVNTEAQIPFLPHLLFLTNKHCSHSEQPSRHSSSLNVGRSGEVLADWKLANLIPIYKKGTRVGPGNCRPVSLTAVPGKIMEKILLGATQRH